MNPEEAIVAISAFGCLCTVIIFLTALRTLERRRDNLKALLESNPSLALTPDAEFAAYRYGLFATDRLNSRGKPLPVFGVILEVLVFTLVSLIGFVSCTMILIYPDQELLARFHVSASAAICFPIAFLLAYSRSFFRMTRQSFQSEYLGNQFLAEAQYLVLIQIFAVIATIIIPFAPSFSASAALFAFLIVIHRDLPFLFIHFRSLAKLKTYHSPSHEMASDIQGMDEESRERLEGLGVTSIYHLSKANPIVLSVASQYGLYTVCDWIGQAQLATEFGLPIFRSLAGRGVRSLDELLRAVELVDQDALNGPDWSLSHSQAQVSCDEPAPKRLRAVVDALTRDRSFSRAEPTSSMMLDRDLISSAVVEALAAPKLVNYDGWVAIDIQTASGGPSKMTIKFLPTQPSYGAPYRLEVKGGLEADMVEFALETNIGWENTFRRTVTVPVKRNSPPFEFEVPGLAGQQEAWLQVLQKKRLLLSIPLAPQIEKTMSSTPN